MQVNNSFTLFRTSLSRKGTRLFREFFTILENHYDYYDESYNDDDPLTEVFTSPFEDSKFVRNYYENIKNEIHWEKVKKSIERERIENERIEREKRLNPTTQDIYSNYYHSHGYKYGDGIINTQNEKGYTALILASIYGRIDMANAIMNDNADLNIRDNYGNTALINACQNNHFVIVYELLKRGAKTEFRNRDNKTALDVSLRESRVIMLLYLTLPLKIPMKSYFLENLGFTELEALTSTYISEFSDIQKFKNIYL
jgi:hypothetical protein